MVKANELTKISFWPYDLFGYLLPGVILILAFSVGDSFWSHKVQSAWLSERWSNVLLLLLIAYIAGTCIAAFSSWFLERQILRRLWLYPTSRSTVRTKGMGSSNSFLLGIAALTPRL